MSNLPISGLPNLTATTNNSLLAIVSGGVTYNISILDFWKSLHPFGTMYQDWIPDAPSAHTIGSIAYPIKSVYVSNGSVFIGPNNSLAIDNSGVLYSTNVFAAPTFQVGNITSSGGVVTTSGYTFYVANNQLYTQNNSGGTTYNLTQQIVPTGGTSNQVLTRDGGTYGWGWSALTASQVPTRYYGAFASMSGQTNPIINQVNVMSADTTEHNNGVILSANTRFVVQNAGVYNIQFSAQLQKTDNGTNTVYVWFRKNGTNISRSNTAVDVSKQAGGNGKLVLAWNLIETFNANDYVEIVWQSDDLTMSLATFPASGNYPAIPSVIVTLTQV